MKTIIKGLKKIKWLYGIYYFFDGMPQLQYKTYIVEPNDIIQELDFELITRSTFEFDVHTFTSFLGQRESSTITVLNQNNELERLKILKEYHQDGVKTIIVNKITEEEEQKFNYEEIMAEYHEKFNTYYDEFMKTFKNNKPMQIMVQNWVDNGMNKEEIVSELKYKGYRL